MECRWAAHRAGEAADFVVAYICDKCGKKGTVDLCAYHYGAWKEEYGANKLRCTCHGMLSFKSLHIVTGEKEWQVNSL